MPSICVVVYPQSYVTVRHFVDYLCDLVLRTTGQPADLRVAATMEEAAPAAGSVVLLIGYKFPQFERLEECYTAFLNFSVMYPVRRRFYSSWGAARMMRAKRRSFLEKLPGLDVVLDFYPQHGEVLRRKIAVPVSEFRVNVLVNGETVRQSIRESDYDVCVVGADTRRRRRVYCELERSGLRLSPMRTEDFPGMVGRSKLVLNVRSERYDNLEVPRIVTALAMGRCVLSEASVGLHDLFPADVVWSDRYGGIAGRAVELLSDIDGLEEGGARAEVFMQQEYGPSCERRWVEILRSLEAARDQKLKSNWRNETGTRMGVEV